MKIEEAINILHGYDTIPFAPPNSPFSDALRLGIEALKRCATAKVKGTIWDYRLLLGETED